jgi:hypothetical protein
MNEGKKQGIEKFIYGRFIAAKKMFGLSITGNSCHFAVWQQLSPNISPDLRNYLKTLEKVIVERNCENFMVNRRKSLLTKQ